METNTLLKLEVFSEDIPHAVLWYKVALRCKCYHFGFMNSALCMVCIVSGVHFQGWDIGTLGYTLSGCVTQDPL